MNSFKIAKMNFKNNIRTYLLYIIAMVFAVSSYYNFWNLSLNPQVNASKEISMYINATNGITIFFMIIFLIFFIMYSSNFFLNERKKEIGLYSLMGIDNNKLAFIFASEGLFLGAISILVGLFVGILFSKLFMMILAKVAILNIVFKFNISLKAILITSSTFIVIFLVSFIVGYIKIIRMNLIDLIHSGKTDEKAPKVIYFSGLISIIILIIAYIIAVSYKKIGFGTSLYSAVILVIIGTTLFFRSFFTIFISRLIKNKHFLYKGTNIVSYSNIFFRIQDNYKTLAAVCVLVTATITSLATVASVKYYVEKNYEIDSPFTISYISKDEKEIEKVNNLLHSENVIPKLNTNYKYIEYNSYAVINRSTFRKILNDLDYKNKDKILNKYNIDNKSSLYIEAPGTMGSLLNHKSISLSDKNYNILNIVRVPTFGKLISKATIVIDDDEYNNFKNIEKENQFNGILLEAKNSKEKMKEININIDTNSNVEIILTTKLMSILKEPKDLYTSVMTDLSSYNVAGVVFFLGSFMAFVFMFATGSILYFKIVGEALKEKNRFTILKNIGTTKEEIEKSIKDQVKIYYISPYILGIIHSSFAIYVLSMLMTFPLYIPMIGSIVILGLVLYVFYRFTIKKYIETVLN